MSFFGTIGYIMQGSGIKEILSLIYAPKSLQKLLNGYAYAKAVEAHKLLQLTFATIICKDLVLYDIRDKNLIITIESVMKHISYNDIESCDETSEALLLQFNQKLKKYDERGLTAKLWVQYFHMESIAKEFLRAERMGDWLAHLNTVKEMLPYFHASGHFPYAKSAHLYLQDMLKLNASMKPYVYQRFRE